jgi:hypothetical protein
MIFSLSLKFNPDTKDPRILMMVLGVRLMISIRKFYAMSRVWEPRIPKNMYRTIQNPGDLRVRGCQKLGCEA